VVNAHLWEFPNVEFDGAQADLRQTARRVLGFTPRELKPLCSIKHSITRYRITLTAFAVDGNSAVDRARTWKEWVGFNELKRLPFPSAHRKIIATLKEPRRHGPKNRKPLAENIRVHPCSSVVKSRRVE
jgi:adenine-specific DNA glycosylase